MQDDGLSAFMHRLLYAVCGTAVSFVVGAAGWQHFGDRSALGVVSLGLVRASIPIGLLLLFMPARRLVGALRWCIHVTNSTTYYSLLIAVANFGVGRKMEEIARHARYEYSFLLGEHYMNCLPPVTSWTLRFGWWPYAITAVASALLLVTLTTRLSRAKLNHVIIALLAIDAVLLPISTLGFVVPSLPTVPMRIQ